MKLMRPPMSMLSLSLCLGLTAPALAQEAAPAPAEASQPVVDVPQTTSAAPADAPAAFTPPRPPNFRIYFANIDFLRYNPIGIESQNRLVFQKRMSDSDSPLMRDTFLSGALALKLNPAGMRVGTEVTYQPIAMLNVKATYEYARYFGAFGFLQSYPGPLADYSDDSRAVTEDSAYSTSGQHIMLEPTLQAKFGSIVVKSKTSIEYWNVKLRDGEQGTFYDALHDTLVPGKGWIFTNDSDVLLLASPQLTLGARFSGVFPRYDGQGGSVSTADNSHMRIGPMVAYSFNTRERSSFNRPTLFVNAAWYLKHPNREGAFPYIASGFSFTTDLVSVD